MAARTTSFATGPRMIAFRALESVLREAPSLQEVRTFTSWTGERLDGTQVATGMMPYLGMTPLGLPNEIMGQGRNLADVAVRIEIAVQGLVAEDFINFWDAVEDAVVKGRDYRDTSVFCFLQTHRILINRVVAPPLQAFGTEHEPASEFLAGSGLIVLRISRSA